MSLMIRKYRCVNWLEWIHNLIRCSIKAEGLTIERKLTFNWKRNGCHGKNMIAPNLLLRLYMGVKTIFSFVLCRARTVFAEPSDLNAVSTMLSPVKSFRKIVSLQLY